MNKVFVRPDLWFTFILFLLVIPTEYIEVFSALENQSIGLRHIIRHGAIEPHKTAFPRNKVLIVTTDEEFYKEYKGWPLRRADIAKLVVNLKSLGAKVIALDMLIDFPNSYGEDPILAKALKEAGNTLLGSRIKLENGVFKKINLPIPELDIVTETAYTNHPQIGSMLSRVRVLPESAGKLDHWPFAIKALAMYLGVEPKLNNHTVTIGEIVISLDHFNDIWIDFPALPGDQKHLAKIAGITAIEFLDLEDLDEDEIEELKLFVENKIVLVGDTSIVSHDIFDTPVGEVYGVEIIADTISTLLKGAPIKPASTTAEITILFVILAGILGSAFLSRFRNYIFVSIIVLYIGFCFLTYAYLGIAFSMSYVLTVSPISFVTINLYLFMIERRQKVFIRRAFSQYLSPSVVSIIEKDTSKLSLGGEKRIMTAFFSDVQGFSTISESLTPEELVLLLNEYLTEMCTIIINYDGTIDKFEGDAIIAFWGAPLIQPDHAKRTCFASIEMQNVLIRMRKTWQEFGMPMLTVRMGINSGPMIVGNMGSQQRMDYTIMGDAVNLAARLEGANKFYKTFSMISENTYEMVKDSIDSRELDVIRVVGKNEPITIYEILAKKNELSGEKTGLIEKFSRGLDLYKDLDFAGAITSFEKALEIDSEDGPSQTYIERCRKYLESAPDNDWDGVYTLTSKG